ncbi:MAG: hypothetical protein WCT53_03925 [Candidatus Gracilibacteria bacterium]
METPEEAEACRELYVQLMEFARRDKVDGGHHELKLPDELLQISPNARLKLGTDFFYVKGRNDRGSVTVNVDFAGEKEFADSADLWLAIDHKQKRIIVPRWSNTRTPQWKGIKDYIGRTGEGKPFSDAQLAFLNNQVTPAVILRGLRELRADPARVQEARYEAASGDDGDGSWYNTLPGL